MESGQMVIDKERHLDVMLLVRYMMEHHDFVSLPPEIPSDNSGLDSPMAIKIFSDSPFSP